MAIEQLTTIDIGGVIALIYALAISGVAAIKAVQAKNYKKAAETAGEMIGSIVDFFDPDLPEANVAPEVVAERFGTTVPLVATTGLSVGDVTVVGLYSRWVKYEKQNQIPLTQVQPGDNISVVIESKRAGTAILGLKIDEAIYDMRSFTVRDDLLRPAGSTENEDKYRSWYVFKVPTTITAGEHTFSIVEGYDVEDTETKDQVCWFEESAPAQVQVA